MFQNIAVFQSSVRMARHASAQQSVIARNIANADTPGFRARHLQSFSEVSSQFHGGMRQTRSQHIGGPVGGASTTHDIRTEASPNGNSVSVEEEMVAATLARKEHDRALAIYRHGLTVLRTVVSRR